jgi:hypothetical protein
MARKKTNLPFVISVTSNLKSPTGDEWTMELGQKTLIIGSNTSHKSAVLQAVELAVSGAADDITGRLDVRDPGLLLTLAPADTLSSSVTFSGDDIEPASYLVTRENGRAKKPTHIVAFDTRQVMPHRLVRSAVSGGEKTARKAFLEWTADEISSVDVLAKLPTTLHAKYRDISGKIAAGKTAVEQLLATTDYAGKQQRDAAKQVKGAESALSTMGDDLPAKPDESSLLAMEAALDEAQKRFDHVVAYQNQPTNQVIQQQHDVAQTATVELAKQAKQVESEYNQLMDSARIAELTARLFEWATHNQKDACPACNNQHGKDHTSVLFDHWRNILSTEKASVEPQASELKKKFQATNQLYQKRYAELQQIIPMVGNGRDESDDLRNDENDVLTVDSARQGIEDAREVLTQATNASSRWNDLMRMNDTVHAMSQQVGTYKALKSACEIAVGQLLQDQAESFSDLVGTYLPDGWDFGIDLKDDDKEVFRMGLRRNGKLHCALSGAESAAVTSAIAMASSNGTKDPRIIIPEDRAWDSNTLRDVMDSFADFPGQVIMASTTKYARKKPRGWTIIDADAHFKKGTNVETLAPEVEPPSEEAGVSVRSAEILEGMGFEADQVQRMTSTTAADLIRQGLGPNQVTVTKGGKYRVVKQGNVLPLPPGK